MSNAIRLGPIGDVVLLSSFGREFTEGYEDGLYREDRASSGLLRRDASKPRKKNWTLTYETADEATRDRLAYLWELGGGPFQLQVTHMTTTTDYMVFMYPFSAKRILSVWGGLWGQIGFELKEQ
jgi:hypothetical protein